MEEHLKHTYGFNEFRDYQKGIICDLLNKENVFAVLPTGGGKSLLYQFPATYTKKTTIVVSPLISLMNDQCMYLNSKNIKSVCLNSETNISVSQYAQYQIIYATPEFITARIHLFDAIKDKIGLFAIDEAHCVSQWSHDFRESYLELGIIRTTYPSIPMLAVTATATPRVIEDIYELLNIEEVNEYTLGTRRTNLAISILPKKDFAACIFVEPTIIYVQTRKICESVCDDLQCKGVKACYYHGGMSKEEKNKSHEKFTQGTALVIVATISFGMGIDKSDIRHVINYGVTNDIETYYQEIGRAGRDGLPCKATMYYKPQDFATVQFLIRQSKDEKQIRLKMEAMNKLRVFLNENTMCRQQMIDYYFEKGRLPKNDEAKHIPLCNICDNCKCENKDGLTDISDIATLMVRLIDKNYKKNGFSYGVEKTADYLKKSCHPALFTKTKVWLKEVLQILVGKNILKSVSGKKYGATIMINNSNIQACFPIMARLHSGNSSHTPKKTSNLLQHLHSIRSEMAEKHLCIPSVFINDRVLMNIYMRNPKNLTELWKVDGISDEFIMMYGAEFIAKLKRPTRVAATTAAALAVPTAAALAVPTAAAAAVPTAAAAAVPTASAKVPKAQTAPTAKKETTKDMTKRLYHAGKTMGEIVEITQKNRQTIEQHMLNIFEQEDDVDIDPDYFGLTEEYEAEIKLATKKVGTTYLKPIKENVNPNITYAQIKLCLLIMRMT